MFKNLPISYSFPNFAKILPIVLNLFPNHHLLFLFNFTESAGKNNVKVTKLNWLHKQRIVPLIDTIATKDVDV